MVGAWEIDNKSNVSLCILIPHKGIVSMRFALSLSSVTRPVGTNISANKTYGVDLSRNLLVKNALKIGATHVLFWDTDVIPYDNNIIIDLFNELISRNLDILSANYSSKNTMDISTNRYMPSAWLFNKKTGVYDSVDNDIEGIYEVDVVGMGFCLIKTDVFRNIDYPYFIFNNKGDTYKESGSLLLDRILGEDFYFCNKVRNAGYKVNIDFSRKCYHEYDTLIDGDGFIVNLLHNEKNESG